MKSPMLMKGIMAPKQDSKGDKKMKGKKEPIQDLLQSDGEWDVEKFISRKITHAMNDEEDWENMDSKKKAWLEKMLQECKKANGKDY